MYRQYKNIDGIIGDNVVVRIADNAFIPFNPANADYQTYLTWLAEGNVLEPADGVSE